MTERKPRAGGWRHGATLALSPLGLIVGIALWYVATDVIRVPAFILPSPRAVGYALVAGFSRGPFDPAGFWYHTGVTLWEAVLGFALGSGAGLVTGLAIARWRLLERLAYPYIVAFQALPKVAVAPLLVIWFGFGVGGKIVITAVMTFFPLMVNMVAGYQAVEPDRIELARACNASAGQILWKIVLPSAMPFIFAGLNVASVLAILGAIVGEFVGAEAGLGMLLMQYDQAMEIAPLFAVLIVLGVIGYVFNLVIRLAERRVCFWAQRATRPEGNQA
jgi:NitT/TauT family transport system permease protein